MFSSYIMGVVDKKIRKPIRKASVYEKMLRQFTLINDKTTASLKRRKKENIRKKEKREKKKTK